MRRRILANGKSQATVNGVHGTIGSTQKLQRTFGRYSWPDENQALLKSDAPLALVDLYGREEIAPVRKNVSRELYTAYLTTQAKLTQLEQTGSERERIFRPSGMGNQRNY